MSEISPSNRYQQEIFGSLDDQVDQDPVVNIIDKGVDVIDNEEMFAKATHSAII